MIEDWYQDKDNENRFPKELVMGEFLRRNADRYPGRTAIVYGDRRYTYREFNARVNRLANALVALGLAKGQRVGIFAHNSDRCVEAALAVAKAGGVFIPVNFRLVGHEVEYILNFSEAAAVFVDWPVLNVIQEIRPNLRAKHIIVMRPEGPVPGGMLSCDELAASGSDEEPGVDVWEGDYVGLAQTGGTTGRPKGVLITHRSVCSIIYQICFIHNYREDDHGLQAMPSYSSAGIAYDWGATLFHGGTLCIAPLPPFDPAAILEIITREKINHLTLAPVMLDFILMVLGASPGKYDVSSVRTVICAGAPTLPRTREAAVKVFGEGALYVEYSATEMGVATCLKPHEVLTHPLSSGRAALGQEVKVTGLDGRDLPRGEIGEIVVAGTMVTPGYNNNPEANRSSFHGRYLGIGDMGIMDEEGYITIVDRKSDMIISGGSNIYPAEIEEVMIQNGKIAEVAVIGVPHEQWGESVKALVRLKPGQEAAPEEIVEWCRGKMADYRIPRSVEFVADFPRTAAGKIQKAELRRQYWQGAERKI